jgi:hypothetical protein
LMTYYRHKANMMNVNLHKWISGIGFAYWRNEYGGVFN